VAAAVAEALRGELLVYPTDTLYALGGCALDSAVARRVRVAKSRDAGKPLPLVAADVNQARALSSEWSAGAQRLAVLFWPGPLTLVLSAAHGVPVEIVAPGATVAVRVPALALTRALCEGAGPLISTSANLAGERAPATCAEAVSAVGPAAALALDAGSLPGLASTIVDLTGAAPRLVRDGPVAWSEIEKAWLSPGA
jgi:L-threonylcarbamoyladenylate synthase